MKKAVQPELPFSFPVRAVSILFVLVTHFLAELSVFVLCNFFPTFLNHTTHSIQPPFDDLRGKGFDSGSLALYGATVSNRFERDMSTHILEARGGQFFQAILIFRYKFT